MPGLLTLKTDFKSLKYGADRLGGGVGSGQPYIQNDINFPTNILGLDDGLVRGGAIGAATSGLIDTKRVGKFILDHPLFLVKQVGLQLSNPRLEVKKGGSILGALLTGNLGPATDGLLEPTRIYNLGVNTLAQVPVNAFGIHLNRHGILPVQDDNSKYEAIVTNNNGIDNQSTNNRLVGLKSKFQLGNDNGGTNNNSNPISSFLGSLLGIVNKVTGLNIPNPSNKTLTIDQYIGGPGSVYGIGGTTINRTAFTEDATKINDAYDKSSSAPVASIEVANSNLRVGNFYGASTKSSSALRFGSFLTSTPYSAPSGNITLNGTSINISGISVIDSTQPIGAVSSNNPSTLSGIAVSTASDSDAVTGGKENDAIQNAETYANNNLVIGRFFGASLKSSSIFRSDSFYAATPNPAPSGQIINPDGSVSNITGLSIHDPQSPPLGTVADNNPTTLNNYIASDADTNTPNEDAGIQNTLIDADRNLRTGQFFGASNYTSSVYNNNISFVYNGTIIGDSSNVRTTLNDRPSSFNDVYNIDQPLDSSDNANDIALNNAPSSYPGIDSGSFAYDLSLPNIAIVNPSLGTYASIKNTIDYYSTGLQGSSIGYQNHTNAFSEFKDFKGNDKTVGEQLPTSLDNPTYTNSYGDIITINKSWQEATRENRVGSGRQDKINLTPLFNADIGTHVDTVYDKKDDEYTYPEYSGSFNINDLVKFRIQAINTQDPTLAEWMIFRAYITDFSDDVSAEWSDIKYAGRGDKFFIYNGFTRKMQVSFKVAALSSQEMKPMYQKLNFLMGNLMPDYSEPGDTLGILMKGPMMRMTIGNYIDGQLCILNSLNYKISNDTPWEIAIGDKELILPHIIEVSLGFTPIGSQTRKENRLSRKYDGTSHIAQNWNGSSYSGGSEPEYIYRPEVPVVPQIPEQPPKPTTTTPTPIPNSGPQRVKPNPYGPNSDFTGNGNTFQTANQLRVSDQEKRYKFQYGKK